MRIAIVADGDVRERIRCVRCIAAQTSVSAIGAASWDEVLAVTDGGPPVSFILFAPSLPGAPADAIEQLQRRALSVVVADGDGEASGAGAGARRGGPVRVARPIPEETLVLLARRAGSHSAAHRVSFAPVDFLQMVCMSGDSLTLIMSSAGADAGVIEVRAGAVWTAFDALGVGEDAFARLIRPEMRARVRPSTPSAKARTIFRELSELLLDSLRRIDEGAIAAAPPLTATQIEDALASPEAIAATVKELTGTVRRLLLERNYEEAARVLSRLAELDPTSTVVKANLEQLRKLGYAR